MKQVLLVGLFGGVGCITRFLVGAWMLRWLGDRFPWGTLLVNVVGCGCLGALFQLDEQFQLLSREVRVALAAGFLGGLTTFSTFGLDTVRFVELQRPYAAATNVLANLSAGFVAVWIGMLLVRCLYWEEPSR